MKKCLSCFSLFATHDHTCTQCAWTPDKIDDFFAFSPALAYENSGFKENYFDILSQLEANNFWFRARNKLITWALSQYYPTFGSFLEIGCGTGYVLSGIAEKFPDRQYKGCELLAKGLSFAANRQNVPMEFMQMDARHIPFNDEFDCIGAFDVLEHIEEDKEVLLQINQALKPGGLMLLTVPQHQWLWSQMDINACHVRRYNAKKLHEIVEQAGFKIVRSTSFVFSLLPLMYISRLLQRKTTKNDDLYNELRLPSALNSFLEKMLDLEISMIRKGINFSVGGSRLLIARKSS